MGTVIAGKCQKCGFETGWLQVGRPDRTPRQESPSTPQAPIACLHCQQMLTSPLQADQPHQACPRCGDMAEQCNIQGFGAQNRVKRLVERARQALNARQHLCPWCGRRQLTFRIVARD